MRLGETTHHRLDEELSTLLTHAEHNQSCCFGMTRSHRYAFSTRQRKRTIISPFPRLFARIDYWSMLRPNQQILHIIRGLSQLRPHTIFCDTSAAAVTAYRSRSLTLRSCIRVRQIDLMVAVLCAIMCGTACMLVSAKSSQPLTAFESPRPCAPSSIVLANSLFRTLLQSPMRYCITNSSRADSCKNMYLPIHTCMEYAAPAWLHNMPMDEPKAVVNQSCERA